jgi:aryl-alcohol dehydrogenase-like predicted oxidoreductase
LLKDTGMNLDEMPREALRFCLSNPAVSTVIPGMRKPAHVAGNTSASDAGPLPPAILEKVHKHRWLRNYYD